MTKAAYIFVREDTAQMEWSLQRQLYHCATRHIALIVEQDSTSASESLGTLLAALLCFHVTRPDTVWIGCCYLVVYTVAACIILS